MAVGECTHLRTGLMMMRTRSWLSSRVPSSCRSRRGSFISTSDSEVHKVRPFIRLKTMGGGGQHSDDARTTIPSPPRPFRHHRRRAPSYPAANDGLDQPPPVTCPTLGNQPCSLNIRTAQHLCTLVHPSTKDRDERYSVWCGPL